MDALVNGLMEELNCETVFTIPLFFVTQRFVSKS